MARRAGACARSRPARWGPNWGGSGSKSVALLVLEGSRSRRLSEKVLLPVLRNPVCSNQLDADAAEREWDDRHRRSRRRRRHEKLEPLSQLAYVYLPPVFPCYEHHFESRRHGRGITTKTYGRQHRRRDYDTGTSDEDSSNCNASDEDDDIPVPLKPTTMRSQRMRSLATMSKLQHDAATTIQEAAMDQRREDVASSLAEDVLASLVDESIRDVFHGVLQAMVKLYLAQEIDLSRAATPTAVAVATDILDDWTKELVADLLPEVLVDLASEYTARQQLDAVWETLLQDELHAVANDAIADTAKLFVRPSC
ncbi:hypothetical protein JG687_00009535 [Phytophthora cactorum]|uniref:Uncharacterized protein n=1 Tax=Phytophthora cactorum TaxID=29920 RepID=A0A8T1U9L5_9STRA|nr:hypothetical protein JG687_00009535 [Phytophthora cactorum]